MKTKTITNKDLNRVFVRGIGIAFTSNFERFQSLGYCFAILPCLKKIYADNENGLNDAVVRHLEFFNTQPFMAMPIMGVTLAMEESLSKGELTDGSSISSIKVSMMGPFAGIGDSLFWFTLIPICASIGISLAKGGSFLGPLVFILLFGTFNIATRFFGLRYGYKFGTQLIEKVSSASLLQRINDGAMLVALMVLGVMTASMINIPLDFEIGSGDQAMTLQSIFDGIMPNLLPLSITFLVFKGIKNRISPTSMLLILILISMIGAFVGLF